MNGPCSLHRDSIDGSYQVVEAYVPDLSLPLSATRKTVFHRYCNELAASGEIGIFYDGTEDILATAQQCAATIVANACPSYVLVEPIRVGDPRIMDRDVLQRFPERYEQITSL